MITVPDPDETGGSETRHHESPRDARTGRSAAAERIANQTQWVELQFQRARERGDFDDLPGYGKPLRGLGSEHDPDWWVKQLVEREQVTGVLPPALALRKEDAELDQRLDRLGSPDDVRAALVDFNDRVRRALYGNPGGPPLVTRQRDVEAEVSAWWERREQRRLEAARRAAEERRADDAHGTPRAGRRRWRRRTRG